MKKVKKTIMQRNRRLIFIIIVLIIGIIAFINVITNNKKQSNLQIDEQTRQEENTEKYVKILEDGTKLNISDKLKETKVLGDLEITDIQLKYENDVTNLYATVINKSNRISEMKNILITLKDDNNDIIYTLRGIIEKIDANGTGKLNTSITADFANSYDFIIEENK